MDRLVNADEKTLVKKNSVRNKREVGSIKNKNKKNEQEASTVRKRCSGFRVVTVAMGE